jgi:hypothetical protein
MDGTEVLVPSRHLTIQYAREFFAQYGDDLEGIYNEIFRNAKTACEVKNDNYFDALQLTSMMARHTQREFRMFTGSAGDVFIGEIVRYFREMAARVSSNSGLIRVLFVNTQGRCKEIDELVNQMPAHVQVCYAKTTDRVHHFIVADDMVRLEELHGELRPNDLASNVRAKVLLSNPAAAMVYKMLFDSQWDRLNKSVQKNEN